MVCHTDFHSQCYGYKLLTDPFLQNKAEIADLNINQLESHRGSAIFAEKPRLVLFEIVSFSYQKIDLMLIDIQLHLIRTYLLWMIVFVCKCVTLHTTISDRTSSLEKSTFDNLFTESTTMFFFVWVRTTIIRMIVGGKSEIN